VGMNRRGIWDRYDNPSVPHRRGDEPALEKN